MSHYRPLPRRYRPQAFCDVLSQDSTVATLKNAIRLDKIANAYLFCGGRGVGKTTLARLFAKALNCPNRTSEMEPCGECPSCLEITAGQSLDVLEIDGASNRGIDDIRQINETVGYAPSSGRYKIYIIDEVHMLTKEAFNALLKTLEEPPKHVKFFFATTEPHKILPTILSRCQRFDLNRIPASQIAAKLEQIARDLHRPCEPEALHLIAASSDGSLRDAESLLDQLLCYTDGPLTAPSVRSCLGLSSTELFLALDQAFSDAAIAHAFTLTEHLFQSGKDLSHFFQQLIEHYRLLALAKTLGEKGLPPHQVTAYLASSRLYTQPQVLYLLDYLLTAEIAFQKSLVPRIFLEATLLHIIRSKHRIPVEVLIRRLSELEESLLAKEPTTTQEPPPSPSRAETPAAPPIEAPPSSPILKPVPFSPYTQAPPPSPEPVPQRRESPPPRAEAPPLPPEPAPPRREASAPAPTSKDLKHPSHYDTVMRFAAVELEGNLKI